MTAPPNHQCQVFGSPWEGIYGTHSESARRFGRHWHGVFGVGLLDDGAQRSASGRGHVTAYAGDLITTNPGEIHDGEPLGAASRRWRMVYIEPTVMQAMAGEIAMRSPSEVALTRPVIQGDGSLQVALHQLLERLVSYSVAPAPSDASLLACEEALVHTCTLLLHRHGNGPDGRATDASASVEVRKVRDCLADAPLAPPTLQEMATMVGLSRYQLLRRFTRAYGLPPHAWLVQQRLERSRRLVMGGASLADAALDSGFADQSHMTRLFVRQFGFTPGALRTAGAGRR